MLNKKKLQNESMNMLEAGNEIKQTKTKTISNYLILLCVVRLLQFFFQIDLEKSQRFLKQILGDVARESFHKKFSFVLKFLLDKYLHTVDK